MKNYCTYYQARVVRQRCWFLTAHLHSEDHLAFDRTIDKQQSIFEFFVPPANEQYFEQTMELMQREGVVEEWQKMPNRLAQPGAQV